MRSLFYLVLLFYACWLAGQELPPVVSFEVEDYGAGTQNWMISQDEDRFVYVANNQGLLEFNGQQWHLYPSPNETILRSVYAHDERIYTGSYMEFGEWSRTPIGSLTYHSLSDAIKEKMRPDEQIWKIFYHEDYLVFQSFSQFFLYDPLRKNVSVLSPPNGILKSFPTRDGIFFTNNENRLYKLVGGLISPVEMEGLTPLPIIHLWEESESVFVQTSESGCFRLNNNQLTRENRHDFLVGKQVYSATDLRLGGKAFGTVSDGVYIVSESGQLNYHLTQVDGLTNNTVLSLYEDRQNNLWAGTDNGISYVTLSSPFRKYTDVTGRLGTIHSSAIYRGKLYLGSNQGLFCRSLNSSDEFRLVPGTKGQVWSLFKYDGRLFGGHNRGTFLVEEESVSFIFDTGGCWTFSPVPGRPDLLLQGTYSGIWVLEKQGVNWAVRNRIEGFDYSSRFLAASNANTVFISHEYRGVFGIRLDEELRKVLNREDFTYPEKGKNAGIIAFDDEVFYSSRDGLFRAKDLEEGFYRDSLLFSAHQPQEYTSGKMTVIDDRLWYFAKHEFGFIHPGTLSNSLKKQAIPVSAELLNAKSGYENISELSNDTLLIGTAEGYLLIALSAVPLHQHELFLSEATAYTKTGEKTKLSLTSGGQLPYSANNLSFRFTVPTYHKYFRPYFRYRLLGLAEDWSEWSTSPQAELPGLPYGDYTLEVESLLGRRSAEAPVTYSFTILRPWYASYLALLFYALGTAALIFTLHRTYTRHYRRKQIAWREENERRLTTERRESELAMTRIRNERLEEDITNKNREMAASAMNLVRKNELLQKIKADLLAGRDYGANIKRVVKTIDQNLDESETWNLFRDAFENADQDFFKKVKDLHPDLTPTDLKLCAYLRLNLSSKEIAPLLNISVRSIEVKRYRLRKKMNLERETGLTDYILGL